MFTFAARFGEIVLYFSWPVRLTVRTSGFHPGNRGSIPLRATEKTFNPLFVNKMNGGFFIRGRF